MFAFKLCVSFYLEEFVNLSEVDPLLGIQFVDVAAVSIHEVQTKSHNLQRKRESDQIWIRAAQTYFNIDVRNNLKCNIYQSTWH